MERSLRQTQLPFAAVRRQGRRDESPDFGAVAVADPEMSEGGVVFPSDSGSSADSSQIIVPGTPSESPESPYYRHDSQAAQRQPSTPSPSQPRQLTPEQIAYLQAQEQWQQEQLEIERQAVRDRRSFQAGLRSERAFYEGEFPITCTAPGPNPNEPDYSRPGQTDDRYPWQLYTGRAQQRQQDIDEQRAAIARAETAAIEQRQQIRETTQEELDRLADEARQFGRRRQGGSGSRRKSATAASKRKKIKQLKRKSKYIHENRIKIKCKGKKASVVIK